MLVSFLRPCCSSSTAAVLFVVSLLSSNYLIGSVEAVENEINIESFGDNPRHTWYALNDPVMGGLSTGTATVEDGVGHFKGEVVGVPKLDDAPGFISMLTRGGYFPDLTSCAGLKLTVKENGDAPYEGFRVSFGTNHPTGSMPYARGYKTHMTIPTVGEWTEVYLPFTEFSDYWDPKTGLPITTCEEDNQYCPDDTSLQKLLRFEIQAEGVLGKIDLQVKSIDAVGCTDSTVPEDDPNPGSDSNSGGAPSNSGGAPWNNQGSSHGGNNRGDREPPKRMDNGDIRIESFSDPQHSWFSLNDPVMGGNSSASVVIQNDAAIFDGEVVDVPFLSAPGFIKMETRGGEFPDVSHCKALKINLMAMQEYEGLRVSFGVHHREDAQPYVRGYKAHFKAPVGSFGDVIIPFDDFSDNWDPYTGDVVVTCAEDAQYCANRRALRDFSIFSIMGEGIDGKVHLEVKSVDATQCSAARYGMTDSNGSNGGTIALWVLLSFGFVGSVFGAFFLGKRRSSGKVEFEMGEVDVKTAQIA